MSHRPKHRPRTPVPRSAFDGQQYLRAYVQLAVQMGSVEDASAQLTLEVPLSIQSIQVMGPSGVSQALPPPVPHPENNFFHFSDADPTSGITLDVFVFYDYELASATGTCSLIFLVPPNDGQTAAPPARWWAVTADNQAGGKARFGVSADANAKLGPVVGDPAVAAQNPHPSFNATGTLALTGTVAYGFLSADHSLPAGAPPFPPIFGGWTQVGPAGAPAIFTMSPVVPTGNRVSSPAGVLAPAVANPTEYAFELSGGYGTPGSPIVIGTAVVNATISPPVTLASAQRLLVGSIAVDGANVYWHTFGAQADSNIMKVPKGGGVASTLASGRSSPAELIVDSTNAYWVESNSIFKIPLVGGAVTPIVVDSSTVMSIATRAGAVFWTNSAGQVMKAPIAGGSSTVLASSQSPFVLAVDAINVYWVTQGDFSSGVGCSLTKVPIGGGSPVTLGTFNSNLAFLALDAQNVYVTLSGTDANGFKDGAVVKVPLGGGNPIVLAKATFPTFLAVDDASVYWMTNPFSGGLTIMKVPITTGAPITVVTDPKIPLSMTADGTGVYWTTLGPELGSGTIMKAGNLADLQLPSGQVVPRQLLAVLQSLADSPDISSGRHRPLLSILAKVSTLNGGVI